MSGSLKTSYVTCFRSQQQLRTCLKIYLTRMHVHYDNALRMWCGIFPIKFVTQKFRYVKISMVLIIILLEPSDSIFFTV